MAGGNKERAMLQMADHVKAANAIYKNTDFNGDKIFEGRLNLYSCTSVAYTVSIKHTCTIF